MPFIPTSRIYLDNAATTPLDAEVLNEMMPYLTEKFGNPSSIYSYGRETKMAIEKARKKVAQILCATPGEIFFTSCATESTNTVVYGAVRDLQCRNIITSAIEHHATLHSVQAVKKEYGTNVKYVQLNELGHVDLAALEQLLSAMEGKTLVALMHANNEVGNLLKIKAVGELCQKYDAYFYSDMVQSIGHYPVNLEQVNVHFAAATAHKFHGPKGAGMLYVKSGIGLRPFVHGGAQERDMRAGTENVYGIVGFAKALELATERYEHDSAHIRNLKAYMTECLNEKIPGITFNGDMAGSSLYTVLNVSFPMTAKSEMLLFSLDMAGICVSGGSACTSGANHVSHVIEALHPNAGQTVTPIRFSFSRNNTTEQVDFVIGKLQELL